MLTEAEKKAIVTLRSGGVKQTEIADILGIHVSRVKMFCSRNNIKKNCDYCINCYAVLPPGYRKFCSAECRNAWWKENKTNGYYTKEYRFVCNNCGKEFVKYRNDHPKYCSHKCYIESRYGKKC